MAPCRRGAHLGRERPHVHTLVLGIDGGGPARRRRNSHASTDFVFPQLAAPSVSSASWAPGLVNYLFLAFNTSTAFSPTDTLVLSCRAKLLMMAQSLIALVVIAVLAARAVNTL